MKKTFVLRKLSREFAVRPWAVFEKMNAEEERLVSSWKTREQAREAARQLNREEPKPGTSLGVR